MKHGRTSPGSTGAVHAVPWSGADYRASRALCGQQYISYPVDSAADPLTVTYRGRWDTTEEPITCKRCLRMLESLAAQALADGEAITTLIRKATGWVGGGSHPRPPDEETVRRWRAAWPVMSRAVADLLRHRGVKLSGGWLGAAHGPKLVTFAAARNGADRD